MADVDQVVSNFLRDAQYRCAELSIEIDDARRSGNYHQGQVNLRAELILWMDILYDSRTAIFNAYNFLWDWTDQQIIAECEYLRKRGGMNEIPYITFAGYSPQIRNEITGEEGGSGLPSGNYRDHIAYNSSGVAVTEPFPEVGGMVGETIDQYFS